jgi:glycerol uptake facilitator
MSDSTTDTSTAQTTEAPPGPATPPLAAGVRRGRGPRSWLAGTYVGEMVAEFFGTFVLIAFGCGSVAVAVVGLPGSGRQDVAFGAANWLIIAWGWGLGVVFGVYVCSGISGGHINPAVTLAFALRRKFPWRKLPGYWLAQVAGAFAAAAVVYAVYDAAINAFNQTNNLADKAQSLPTFSIFATFPAQYFHGSWVGPFVDQIVGTALLLAIIAALLDRRNSAPAANLTPFVVGLVVVVIGLSFGTNAGYAINPARDLGPRIFTLIGGWGDIAFPGSFHYFSNYWWIPIAGPLIGAVVGIVGYDILAGRALRDTPVD